MTATRLLAAALGLGSVLGISCYSEPRPPSTYRYACDADDDCNPNEVCRRGLCERPCTQLEVAAGAATEEDASDDPCPITSGYAACFNGACANTCAVGSDYCAKGQECIDLAALGIDIGGGGSSNPFGGGSDDPIGICGVMCEPGDDICPDSEVCLMGFCAVDCSTGQVCPDGYDCLFGVCIPATGLPSDEGGSSDAGSGSDGSGSDGASTDPDAGTGASDTGATGMGSEPDDDEERR
jgi:hypothetical protein